MQEIDDTITRACRDTIGDALRRSAARNPEKDALIFGERCWSYAELDVGANHVANALLARGLEKGDRVAAYGMNSDAYVLLWLGCSKAGLIHVPVNFHLTGEELLYILNQSGSKALFYDPGFEANVEDVRDEAEATIHGTIYDGDDFDVLSLAQSGDDASEPEVDADEGDLAQILYTSGTTSAPKGAMMTHKALMAEYTSCIEAMEFRPNDRALHALPLYHSQIHCFFMPQLLVGVTNFVVITPEPEQCCELIEREKINSMFAPPTVWISFLRHPAFEDHDLSSLQKVQYAASIMPVPVLKELRERLPNAGFYHCYGQSETGPLATILRPEEHEEERLSSAGRPALRVETRVVDPETMQDALPGEAGEIVHRSPHLLSGYWEKPEETEEAFEGGWFHSGDLGYFDEEGYLYVVDRVKDVINTGGVQVSGRDVEDALYDHEAVSEVAVIGLPDEKWIEVVSAVIVPKEDVEEENLREEMEEHAREKLADYKRPKHIFFVEDLPRNAAGKILKRELRSRFGSLRSRE